MRWHRATHCSPICSLNRPSRKSDELQLRQGAKTTHERRQVVACVESQSHPTDSDTRAVSKPTQQPSHRGNQATNIDAFLPLECVSMPVVGDKRKLVMDRTTQQ